MCLESTNSLNNLKEWYAFMNESTFRGLQDMVRRMVGRLIKDLTQFSDRARFNLQQQMESLLYVKDIKLWKPLP
jgi:hypothetical protein